MKASRDIATAQTLSAPTSSARRMAEQLGDYLKRLEEAKELRRRNADWAYIESRPEPLRTALKLLVETGDLWYSSKLSGVPLDELNEERKRARIPLVVA